MPYPEPHHDTRPHPWPPPQPRRLGWADRATRATAMTTVAALAVLAGATSYRHMVTLAERSGQHGADAHAFPLTVDGLDLIGVLVLLTDRRTGRNSGWLPWTVLAIGALASITANIAVAPANPIARAISGWTAIALLAAAKLLAHLLEPAPATRTDPRSHPGHAPEPTGPHHTPTTATPDRSGHTPTTSAATPDTGTPADNPQPLPAHTGITDAPGRLPTSEAALTRWQHIWEATRHQDHATAGTAAAHGVSLRTLQFIRSAGRAGHLTTPISPATVPTPDDTSAPPAGRTSTEMARPVPASAATLP